MPADDFSSQFPRCAVAASVKAFQGVACGYMYDGHLVYLFAPSIEHLERAWNLLPVPVAFDRSSVQPAAITSIERPS